MSSSDVFEQRLDLHYYTVQSAAELYEYRPLIYVYLAVQNQLELIVSPPSLVGAELDREY